MIFHVRAEQGDYQSGSDWVLHCSDEHFAVCFGYAPHDAFGPFQENKSKTKTQRGMFANGWMDMVLILAEFILAFFG